MESISLAEAKARLSELVSRAAEGETVEITKRGKPVAQITPIGKPRKPIDVELLRSVSKNSPTQKESAGDFVRRMRDSGRY
jgi:prevent-host-death family protein